MPNWELFFAYNGNRLILRGDHDMHSEVSIEDLYQMFKDRFMDEVETVMKNKE